MQININDTIIEFPASLAEITLGQRIAFHNEHVAPLEASLKEIIAMDNGFKKEFALQDYHDEMAMRFVAFFAGCTVEAVMEYAAAELVLTLYHTVYAALIKEESEMNLQSEFIFNDETWVLQSPQLNQHHPMTFGELIDAKQLMKDLIDDDGTRWDLLLKVCCMFLRKPNESYSDHLLKEDGERMQIMKTLPLDIAVSVGFFLTSSINLYRNTLASSNQAVDVAELTSQDTSISGDGSTS